MMPQEYNKDYFALDAWHPAGYVPNAHQIRAWKIMKDALLNPIRAYLGMPVILTNVIRIASDYERLLKAGYKPSPTSDHYAGQPITLPGGRIFTESTFAADFGCKANYKQLCRAIYETIELGKDVIPGLKGEALGQLILEGQIRKGKYITWIHIGLSAASIYPPAEVARLNASRKKDKYLEFKNGIFVKSTYI